MAERGLRSVANFTRQDAHEFLQLAAAIPIEASIQAYALEAGNDALAGLAEGSLGATAVLVPGEG